MINCLYAVELLVYSYLYVIMILVVICLFVFLQLKIVTSPPWRWKVLQCNPYVLSVSPLANNRNSISIPPKFLCMLSWQWFSLHMTAVQYIMCYSLWMGMALFFSHTGPATGDRNMACAWIDWSGSTTGDEAWCLRYCCLVWKMLLSKEDFDACKCTHEKNVVVFNTLLCQMVVDALLLCFCEDCKINNGSAEWPYYMNASLMVNRTVWL